MEQRSAHTKTGVALILIADLFMLIYMNIADVNSLAFVQNLETEFKASAVLRFISFILMQASAIFSICTIFYKSSGCRIAAIFFVMIGEMFMILSLLVYGVKACKHNQYLYLCPANYNQKFGVMAMGIIFGFLGAIFLIIDVCGCYKNIIRRRGRAQGVDQCQLTDNMQPQALSYVQSPPSYDRVQNIGFPQQMHHHHQQVSIAPGQQAANPSGGYPSETLPKARATGANHRNHGDEGYDSNGSSTPYQQEPLNPFTSSTPVKSVYQY